jgi:hypothetical protein
MRAVERIDDHDELYRRILHYHLRPDGSVSSAAFMTRSKKPDPDCSVHLARITSPEESLRLGLPGQGVVVLYALVPRSIGLSVRHDPQPGDRGHCLIQGLSLKEQCAKLADASRVVVPPPTR